MALINIREYRLPDGQIFEHSVEIDETTYDNYNFLVEEVDVNLDFEILRSGEVSFEISYEDEDEYHITLSLHVMFINDPLDSMIWEEMINEAYRNYNVRIG